MPAVKAYPYHKSSQQKQKKEGRHPAGYVAVLHIESDFVIEVHLPSDDSRLPPSGPLHYLPFLIYNGRNPGIRTSCYIPSAQPTGTAPVSPAPGMPGLQ